MSLDEHEHVTLDGAVFHAYQDIAYYARDVKNPPPGLSLALERLGESLEQTYRDNQANPRHHLPEPVEVDLTGHDLESGRHYWVSFAWRDDARIVATRVSETWGGEQG